MFISNHAIFRNVATFSWLCQLCPIDRNYVSFLRSTLTWRNQVKEVNQLSRIVYSHVDLSKIKDQHISMAMYVCTSLIAMLVFTMGVYDEKSIQNSEVSGIQKYEFEKQCKAAHWVTVFFGGYIWFIVGL